MCNIASPFFLIEDKYKQIVHDNLANFIKFTNFARLLPILVKHSLVNETEAQEISYSGTLGRVPSFFYTVLPSKGSNAYYIFARCLSEEGEHLGHKTLLQLLVEETTAEELAAE